MQGRPGLAERRGRGATRAKRRRGESSRANNSRNDPEAEAIVVRWPGRARKHLRFSLPSPIVCIASHREHVRRKPINAPRDQGSA